MSTDSSPCKAAIAGVSVLTRDFGTQGCRHPGRRVAVSGGAERSLQKSTVTTLHTFRRFGESKVNATSQTAKDGTGSHGETAVRPSMDSVLVALKLIRSHCRSLTPPVDEDERNEEGRRLEASARKELDELGCPPCYPPDVDLTTRNVPDKFQAIVGYWMAVLWGDDVVLRAQLRDYQEFLASQRDTRRRFGKKWFSRFEDAVRERRQRHGLRGDVHLLLDPRQQSRLQNWVEFQNYHLKALEGFTAEQDKVQQQLDDARKQAGDGSTPVTRRVGPSIGGLEYTLVYFRRMIERRNVLLDWIERQRQAMDAGHPTPPREKNSDESTVLSEAGPRTSAGSGRSRRSKASSPSKVLGPRPAKVTKAPPKQRKPPIRKLRQPDVDTRIQDLDSTPPAAQMHPKAKPRPAKEDQTSLRPVRPQRASKATARSADRSATQRRGTRRPLTPAQPRSKRRPGPRGPQPAAQTTTTTRSGRISRPPARWAPG